MSPVTTSESGGLDRRRELLPEALRPLFDDRFVASCDLIEEHAVRLVLGVLRECGLEPALAAPVSVAELADLNGLDEQRSAVVLDWMLRLLAQRELIALESGSDGTSRYVARVPLPALDAQEVEAQQDELDPACLPSYRAARVAAASYPAFLRGEVKGEAVLFGPDRFDLWQEYFSNQHPLYAVNNAVPARAIRDLLPNGPGDVLELGGGLGSGALELLETLGPERQPRSYLFSEFAPFFLRRGRRALAARFPDADWIRAAMVDMDRPLADQAIEPGSRDLVIAVNTLHVARDLSFTLAEARRALRPGGWMVLGECVRPFAGVALYTELVFNLLETFRAPTLVPPLRPNGGFLTPEQWLGLLGEAGFEDVSLYPDVRRIRDVYPNFVVAAVIGRNPG